MKILLPLCTLGLASALSVQAPAQEPAPLGCDTTNIEWVLPGRFDQARERARSENRMLLIKGISFGVDTLGATCATKGRW